MKPSHFDYMASLSASAAGYSFYALLMAAMRDADSKNLEALKSVFPEEFEVLMERRDAPGGLLIGERGYVQGKLYERTGIHNYQLVDETAGEPAL